MPQRHNHRKSLFMVKYNDGNDYYSFGEKVLNFLDEVKPKDLSLPLMTHESVK